MNDDTMLTARKFEALASHVGVIDRSDRVRLAIGGPDRAKFLHNLTTNEIKRLPDGRGCETFVTSPQGKTIAYVIVLAEADQILARADAGGAALALPHLQKYGVFDDVLIDDASGATFELHLFGPRAVELAERIAGKLPEPQEYAHTLARIADRPIRLVRESPTGMAGLSVIGAVGDLGPVRDSIVAHGRDLGLLEVDRASFDLLRIEAGSPVFGRDVTEKNLPQEFGRDDRAISFVKGCYLGQETVARIDALGHVNQLLRGLRFDPLKEPPLPGSLLEFDGKPVGVVTSSAFSPRRNAGVGLGLVKTQQCRAGTPLQVRAPGEAEVMHAMVVDLPMADGP